MAVLLQDGTSLLLQDGTELLLQADGAAPLAIDTEPTNASVVEGVVAQFSVVASGGTAPYTYQWYNAVGDVALVEGVTGDNVTTDTLSVTTTLGDDGNTYYVIITDSA